ncbi:MAG: hypothetical protein HYY93_15870 [Planctomycetes bacterium]|nr:hypothetical protein [Planctomycetota bacterium]
MPATVVSWRARPEVRVFLTVWILCAFYASPAVNSMGEQYLGLALGLIKGRSVTTGSSVLDLSVVDGRYASGLPPGTAVLCLPAVALACPIVELVLPIESPMAMKIFGLASVWFAIIPLAAWVATAQFRVLRRLEVPPGAAVVTVLAAAFGSMWFFYSTRLIGTMAGSCATFLAFSILAIPKRKEVRTRAALGAGFLLGAAITMDFGVAPVVLGVLLFALLWHGG